MFNSMSTVLPHVKTAGCARWRSVVRGARKRYRIYPRWPKSGVPGFESTTWWGLVAPAKTPAGVIGKLSAQIERILADADVVQRMAAQGSEVQSSTPQGLARFMREELARTRKVIASAGIKSE